MNTNTAGYYNLFTDTYLFSNFKFIHLICLSSYHAIKDDLLNSFVGESKSEIGKYASGDRTQDIIDSAAHCSHAAIQLRYSFMFSMIHEFLGEWDQALRLALRLILSHSKKRNSFFRGYTAFIDMGFGLCRNILVERSPSKPSAAQLHCDELSHLLDYVAMKICTISLYTDFTAYSVALIRKHTDSISMLREIITGSSLQDNDAAVQEKIYKRLSKVYHEFSVIVEKYEKLHSVRRTPSVIKRSISDIGQGYADTDASSSPSSIAHSEPTEIISKLSNAGKAALGLVTTFLRSTFKRAQSLENVLIDHNVLNPYYDYYLQAIEYRRMALYTSILPNSTPQQVSMQSNDEVEQLLAMFRVAIDILLANDNRRTAEFLTFQVADIYRLCGLYKSAVVNYIKCHSLMAEEIFRILMPDFFSNVMFSCRAEHADHSVNMLAQLLGTQLSSQIGEYILIILSKLTEVLYVSGDEHNPREIQCHSRLCPAFFDANFCIYSNRAYLDEECTYQFTISRSKDAFLSDIRLVRMKLLFSHSEYDHEYIHRSTENNFKSMSNIQQEPELSLIDPVLESASDEPVNVDLNNSQVLVLQRKVVFRKSTKLKLLEILTVWLVANTKVIIKYMLDDHNLSESRLAFRREWLLASGEFSQDPRTKSKSFKCLSDNPEFVAIPKTPSLTFDILCDHHTNTGGTLPAVLKIKNEEDIDINTCVYVEISGDNDFNDSCSALSRNAFSEADQIQLHFAATESRAHTHGKLHIRNQTIGRNNTCEIPLWLFIPFHAPGSYNLSAALIIDAQDRPLGDLNEDLHSSGTLSERSDAQPLKHVLRDIRDTFSEIRELSKPGCPRSAGRNIITSNYCIITRNKGILFTKVFQTEVGLKRIPGDHFFLSPETPTESLIYSKSPPSPTESGISLDHIVSLKLSITEQSDILIRELTVLDAPGIKGSRFSASPAPEINVYCSTSGSERLFCADATNGIVRCACGVLYKFYMRATTFYRLNYILSSDYLQQGDDKIHSDLFVKIVWRSTEKSHVLPSSNSENWHIALLSLDIPQSNILFPISVDMSCAPSPILFEPFKIDYIVYNHSMKSHHIEVRVPQSEDMAFTGVERVSFCLLPLSSRKMSFNMIPLACGSVAVPRITTFKQPDEQYKPNSPKFSTIMDVATSTALCVNEHGIAILVLPKPIRSPDKVEES